MKRIGTQAFQDIGQYFSEQIILKERNFVSSIDFELVSCFFSS